MYPKHLYISVRLGLQEREKKNKKNEIHKFELCVDMQHFFQESKIK